MDPRRKAHNQQANQQPEQSLVGDDFTQSTWPTQTRRPQHRLDEGKTLVDVNSSKQCPADTDNRKGNDSSQRNEPLRFDLIKAGEAFDDEETSVEDIPRNKGPVGTMP